MSQCCLVAGAAAIVGQNHARRPAARRKLNDWMVAAKARSRNHVTTTLDGKPLNRTGYQVIITKDVRDDPHGFSRPTFDVHVLPSVTSLTVPHEFLEPRTGYELEVLALEISGNQTISVLFFQTQ
jgi:hypothetical protein